MTLFVDDYFPDLQMFLDHESSSIIDCPPSPPEVHESKDLYITPFYSVFHRFGQAKFVYGGSI